MCQIYWKTSHHNIVQLLLKFIKLTLIITSTHNTSTSITSTHNTLVPSLHKYKYEAIHFY